MTILFLIAAGIIGFYSLEIIAAVTKARFPILASLLVAFAFVILAHRYLV